MNASLYYECFMDIIIGRFVVHTLGGHDVINHSLQLLYPTCSPSLHAKMQSFLSIAKVEARPI